MIRNGRTFPAVAAAITLMSLAGCTGEMLQAQSESVESVGVSEPSSSQPDQLPDGDTPAPPSTPPDADDTEAGQGVVVEDVPLLAQVDAVTFLEKKWTGLGHNCATNYPVQASVMMSNPTATHIAFDPGYRVKAFNSKGKVIWTQDGNLGTDLWPGEAVLTWFWLCEELYERVDSMKVMNRGPGTWQPLEDWKGKRPDLAVTDVQLILYSITGGLSSDVRATVVNRGRTKVAEVRVSVVLYDGEDRITAIDGSTVDGLRSGAREDVEMFGLEWRQGRPVRAEVVVVPEITTDRYGDDWNCDYFAPDVSPDKSGHYECLKS